MGYTTPIFNDKVISHPSVVKSLRDQDLSPHPSATAGPGSFAPLCGDPVAEWLLHEAHEAADTLAVIAGLCDRLLKSGFSLYRLFLTTRTLHPQVASIGFQWRRGHGTPTETSREHGIDRQEIYLRSPIKLIHDGVPEIRRRLCNQTTPRDFPILLDLEKEGATDYLVLPVRFSRQRINAISLATDRPGGFSGAELTRLRGLIPLLALVLEIAETQRVAATLLDTYLGPDAGRRVLGGLIQRGDGTTISAALWYCDLRGFTSISETLARNAVIALLNDYFECMVGAVRRHGGEVLKFIGDAMLAIFQIADDLDRDRACLAALAAAHQALFDLQGLSERRHAVGKPALKADIALHTGAVMYGNIGAPDRLDFTVIGPAVNLVTRLEPMCAQLGVPVLASAQFASHCGSQLISAGRHRLRGIEDEREVFILPRSSSPFRIATGHEAK
jgi:adenylate cyclase